jgi:hypothetical protein
MAGRGMAWLVKAWPGVARQGFCGLRPVGGRVRLRTDRRRFKARLGGVWLGWAGLGTARLGRAWRGKGCNQALALGGRPSKKEQSGRAAWKPWNLADHLA